MARVALLGVVLAALALTACDGDGSSTTAVAVTKPTPIFGVIEIGGCNMAGPNCTSRVLWTDGTVTAYPSPLLELPLAGLAALTPDATFALDPAVAATVSAAVAAADLPTVIRDLPPGQCWACVDGIDYLLLLATSDGEIRISSIETAFDPSVPLIAELSDAAALVGQQIVLPILGR